MEIEDNFTKRIEDLEKANKELETANSDLNAMHVKRSEIINRMAHDMRSPLSVVKSYADMMLMFKDEPVEVREKFLRIIIQASDKLACLINELQNSSREKAG